MSTLAFVKKLAAKNINILGLMDLDPHGLHISLIYKYGSEMSRHEKLHIPEFKYIGISYEDFAK